jgi:hypothetical protein
MRMSWFRYPGNRWAVRGQPFSQLKTLSAPRHRRHWNFLNSDKSYLPWRETGSNVPNLSFCYFRL